MGGGKNLIDQVCLTNKISKNTNSTVRQIQLYLGLKKIVITTLKTMKRI